MTAPTLDWWKSSFSNGASACVETALHPDGGVAVRDSKLGAASPVLRFDLGEWRAFIRSVRAGVFGPGL